MKKYTYSKREWIIIVATLLLAIFAILVGLGKITIGVGGINFLF